MIVICGKCARIFLVTVFSQSDSDVREADLTKASDSVSHSLSILSTVYHYNHWVYDAIRLHVGRRIAEVGAGVGNITQFLLNADQIVCIEPHPPYCDYLRRRFSQHRNVSIVPCGIEQVPGPEVLPGQFDSVVCLNVLEHIDDDVSALRHMRDLLVPGGCVIIFVPAMQWLYGAMDKAMGHVRRYTRSTLGRAMRDAGLEPIHSRYMNLAGVLGWWWNGRVLKHEQIPESATRLFDRMVPFLSAAERLIPPLVGQSVLMVARKCPS